MAKLIIAGGSGFLGRTLAAWFREREWEVIVLSRRAHEMRDARVVVWDGETVGEWAADLDGAAAVINLAGRSVDCRYTAANRRLIMNSRVKSTRALGEAIQRCDAPPPVWLNSSTATIYKHTYGPPHGEDGEIGSHPEAKDKFSIEVARAWEDTFAEAGAACPATRCIALRTAMVFGREPGGVFHVLRRMTRLGLGGRMGHGRQYVSWIHEADFCRAVAWLIERPDSKGVYNVCAPEPLENRKMMALFRRAAGVPVGLPASRWMLEIGVFFLRTETELIIKSRRVIPARLEREGFEFRFKTMEECLKDLI